MKGRAVIACFIFGILGSVVLFQLSRIAGDDATKTAVKAVMTIATCASVFLWKLIDEIKKVEAMGSTDLERLKLIRHRSERRRRATWMKFALYLLSSVLVLLLEAFIKIPEVYFLAAGFFWGVALWCVVSLVRDYFTTEGHAKTVAERERRKQCLKEFRPKHTANGH